MMECYSGWNEVGKQVWRVEGGRESILLQIIAEFTCRP